MKVYWCDNCEVPVLYEEKNRENVVRNHYIDIEDEVIQWIYDNDLKRSFYYKFLNLKEKVDEYINNEEVGKIKYDLENQTAKVGEGKNIYNFALRYLISKTDERDEKLSKCTHCGGSVHFIGKDIRPVFMKERIMLSVLLDKDMTNKNIWNASGNRYIIDGKTSKISVSDFYKMDNIKSKAEEIRNKISNSNEKVDFSKFINVNKYHYKFIYNSAKNFVKLVSDFFSKRLEVVSFSGGKDSTVISDLVRRALKNPQVLHVFGDTMLEFPTTYEYLERVKNSVNHPPFIPVDTASDISNTENHKKGNSVPKEFLDLSKKFGPPSRVMTWCCTIFKTGPIGSTFKQIADQQKILTFYGIRRSESSSRSYYNKISKSPKISKQLVVSPIIDWNDADVWLYLLTRDLDFNEAYEFGFTRVGCLYCPNNSKWSEFLAKIHFEEQSEQWRDFLIDFADSIGKPDPEVYIDTGKWKARQGGQGLSKEELDSNILEYKPCTSEENEMNFTLNRPITEELYELFKPFGIIDKKIGNDMLNEVYVLNPNNNNPILSIQGKINSKQLKIKLLRSKNQRLLLQRVKCQLRKYQSCIGCSACPNICPVDAISLTDGYKINEEKCTHCKKCIAYYHKGCLVLKTTADY